MSKKGSIIILCTFILVSTLYISIEPSSANPIAIVLIEEGSAVYNGENINMPLADVEINITRSFDIVSIALCGTYEFETNETQNTTLAYVYPAMPGGTPALNMTFFIDSIEIEYLIRTWSQVVALNFSDDLIEYTSGLAAFAVFNISLIANTSVILQVFSHSEVTVGDNDLWNYRYIFGSARTFEGDTWERIHIHLVEETPFIATSFYPDEHLTITKNWLVTDAIWDFNVSSMNSNRITFSARIRQPSTSILAFAIWVAGETTLVVVLVFIIRQRGNPNYLSNFHS